MSFLARVRQRLFRKDPAADRRSKARRPPSHHEKAVQREIDEVRRQRRQRFRILACIDGSDESLETVRLAARLGKPDECDIILLYVRPLEHGLASGGLQVRVARQNMLEWGIEQPGIRDLRQGLEILKAEGIAYEDWKFTIAHTDVWGDPLGDNKVEYRNETTGKSIVLKLKTAPDAASGILDQYELGPYNLMILGEPSRWRNEFSSFFFTTGVVQKVAMLAPCSVLVTRKAGQSKSGFFICTDGTARSTEAVKRAAVLAHSSGAPITIFAVAPSLKSRAAAREAVDNARAILKGMQIKVARTKIAVGEPGEQIMRHGAGHQIIVVSDEGRTRWQRIFKGSTAYEVVRGAKTSVLDVR
ncbi:nucleotide-binding universal stress UspA family protein [Rhodoligotrophos appendicifer]|uniref:universal stress protein n=1 Tax=Rhodoligotrophos appendicifer TaxID=987056 RepID=UPI00118661A4|nr:universal stress protein [Rhodoligotrophos appendicifer]